MKIRKQTKKSKTKKNSSKYITFVFLFYDAKKKNPQKVKNSKCLGSKNLRILLVYLSTFDFEVLNVHLTFSLFRGVEITMQWGLKTSTNQLRSKTLCTLYALIYKYIYTSMYIRVYIHTQVYTVYAESVCVCVSVCVNTFVIHKKLVTYCQKYQFVVVIKGKQKSHSKPLVALWLIWHLKLEQDGEQGDEEESAVKLESCGSAAAVLDCSRSWQEKKEADVLPKARKSAHQSGWNVVHLYFTCTFFMRGSKAIKTRNLYWRSGERTSRAAGSRWFSKLLARR